MQRFHGLPAQTTVATLLAQWIRGKMIVILLFFLHTNQKFFSCMLVRIPVPSADLYIEVLLPFAYFFVITFFSNPFFSLFFKVLLLSNIMIVIKHISLHIY